MEENHRTIKFNQPDISDLEIQYVSEALRSGWITTGPRTKSLEKQLASYVGIPDTNCVCLNSATAALEMSLRMLGIGPQEGGSEKDEVITCAYTYTASASVVRHVGATVKLVDCSMNPDSIEMDYDALENAITPNTKAVIPVDLGGVPCDYDRIFEIVQRKKSIFTPSENSVQKHLGRVAVVTDAAHALGASYKGRPVGSISDFTNFSFHAVKNFTTAEGGAIMWKDMGEEANAELYHKLQLYSLHGQSKDALSKNTLGAWEYDIVGTWYKCNMTDIMAALGQAQFERYPKMLERRKEIIEKFDKAFSPLGVETLRHYSPDYQSSGHLYITRVMKRDGSPVSHEERNEIITEMAKRGIGLNVHYKPLPLHTAYKKLGFDIKDYPNAYTRYQNQITLPLHTLLSDEDVDYIISEFCDIVKNYI